MFDRLVQILDFLVPRKRGSVVLHSWPDLDDMVIALLCREPKGVAVTILADFPARALERQKAIGLDGVRIVAKRSTKGVWTYLRSHIVVSTHGMFGCHRRGLGKHSSTPWHGELTKEIGVFVGEGRRHFDSVVVSSKLSKTMRVAEFQLPPSRVHVLGTPRLDVLLSQPRKARVERTKGEGCKWVVYVPTYRRSIIGQVRDDGAEIGIAALSRLLDDRSLGDLTLWVRPHPLAEQGSALPRGSQLASDEALQSYGLTLYDLLAAADLLVTDYSSVWVDFLNTGAPILGYCPDLPGYRSRRGLALEPYAGWFPGPILTKPEDLVDAVRRVLSGEDRFIDARARAKALLSSPPGDSAGRYWELLAAAGGIRDRRSWVDTDS